MLEQAWLFKTPFVGGAQLCVADLLMACEIEQLTQLNKVRQGLVVWEWPRVWGLPLGFGGLPLGNSPAGGLWIADAQMVEVIPLAVAHAVLFQTVQYIVPLVIAPAYLRVLCTLC